MASVRVHFIGGQDSLDIPNIPRQEAEGVERVLNESNPGTTRIGIGNDRTVIINRSNMTWVEVLF